MNKTEWKHIEVSSEYVEEYSEKSYRINLGDNVLRMWLYVPAKLCRFNGKGICRISYLPQFDFAEKLENFAAARNNDKYEITIWKAVKAAIWNSLEDAAEDVDTDEEFDNMLNEWREGREAAAWAVRRGENPTDAAIRAAVGEFDSAFLSKLSA